MKRPRKQASKVRTLDRQDVGKPRTVRFDGSMIRDAKTIQRRIATLYGWHVDTIGLTTIVAHALKDCATAAGIDRMLSQKAKSDANLKRVTGAKAK